MATQNGNEARTASGRANQANRKKGSSRNMDRRNIGLLTIMTLLIIGSIALFMPPSEKINMGLDIQGGLSVVLQAKSTDGSAISSEDMEKSRTIVETRVNALGASEATVQEQGNNQILVQIPGLSDTQTALDTIGRTGKLEFARLDSFTDEDTKTAIENGEIGGYETVSDDYGNTFATTVSKTLPVTAGTYTPLITGDNIEQVTIDKASETSSYYAVNLRLDSEGTKAFADATKELAEDNGQIVIILDGEAQSAPAVQSEITTGEVSITGNYDKTEAQALQTVLESGSLPVSFEYAQSQVVGPTLGQDALASGVLVALIGLLIVMIYLFVFYEGLGIITAAAVAVFAILYLGILALLSAFGLFSLSLAGIAGIVLTIGMAADSSVLTLERFREEIRMGRSVRASSISGVRHAILTSIDADLVSLVSALCLFFLASSSVKGFGMTMALGIFCDIVMMLLFKAPLIRLLAPRSIEKHPGFWGIKDCQDAVPIYTGEIPPKPGMKIKGRFIKKDINFMGVRKVFLTIAAVAMVCCFVIFGVRGLNFGIEFVGGTSISFHGTGDVTTEQVRSAFEEAGESNAVIQTTVTDGEPGFLVRTTTTSAEDATAVANTVANQFGWTTSNFEVTTIGPDWGTSVVRASLIAFLVSIILIIVYIAIRFEYKMGLMAIVALIHDLILVVGIYALVGREITPNTVAALLTILGYSLYDTVVVFHRINDNMTGPVTPKCTFMSMANHSVNQVFIRSINTTLTSLIPVVFMLFLGGETLKDFAFAMAIGLVAGAYSSIAIAVPLYAIWKSKEPRYAKLAKKYGDDVVLFEYDRIPELPAPGAAQAVAAGAVAVAGAGEASGEEGAADAVDTAAASVAGAAVAAAGADGAAAAPSAARANKPQKNKGGMAKSTHGQKKTKRPVKPN